MKVACYAQYKMPAIGFFDRHGELVSCFDPEGYGFELNTTERKLNDTEELVGVYGVKDRHDWFTSFGVIALTRVVPKLHHLTQETTCES